VIHAVEVPFAYKFPQGPATIDKVVSAEPVNVTISTITSTIKTMASQYACIMLEGYMLVLANTIAHIGAGSVVPPQNRSPGLFLTLWENLMHKIPFRTGPSPKNSPVFSGN
jgi:hypothetical protein